MLAQITELSQEVRFGLSGYLDRVDEMTGNYPATAAGGGSSPGSHSDPTSASSGKRDPGKAELKDFDNLVLRAHKAILDLHGRWLRNCAPQPSPTKIDDSGCELCAEIPNHWCARYCGIEVETKARRGEKTRRYLVCYWCYSHYRRIGELPSVDQRQSHAEGRRMRVLA